MTTFYLQIGFDLRQLDLKIFRLSSSRFQFLVTGRESQVFNLCGVVIRVIGTLGDSIDFNVHRPNTQSTNESVASFIVFTRCLKKIYEVFKAS